MEGRDNGRRSRSLVTRPLQRARTFGPRDQDPVRLLFPSRQIAFARRSPRIHLEPCKCCPDHPASRYTHLCRAALTEAAAESPPRCFFKASAASGSRLEGISWRLEALRMCPEPNAEKCQEEPQRLQNRQLALYESRRHRLRGQRISKRLVKDQKARPPVPILCRRSVAGVSPDGGSNDSSLAGQWLTLSFSGIYVHNKVGRGMGNVITA